MTTEAIAVAPNRSWSPLLHRLCQATAVLTWPLLLVGGTVTVYRVGMAVPDWPTTFGVNMFLYDFMNSPWGVFLEHSHRLYASAVGLACVAMAFWVTLRSGLAPRLVWRVVLPAVAAVAMAMALWNSVKSEAQSPLLAGLSSLAITSAVLGIVLGFARGRMTLGLVWLALALVVFQGILGGYRVRLNSATLAFVHGCAAQAFFGLLVVLCVLTSQDWQSARVVQADTGRIRKLAVLTACLVFAQIILGAWLRQFGDVRVVILHAAVAFGVFGHALGLFLRVRKYNHQGGGLLPWARVMIVLATLQMAFGTLAWLFLRPFDGIARPVWPAQVALRLAHQGIGALLLACCVVLALWAYRSLVSPDSPVLSNDARQSCEALA